MNDIDQIVMHNELEALVLKHFRAVTTHIYGEIIVTRLIFRNVHEYLLKSVDIFCARIQCSAHRLA